MQADEAKSSRVPVDLGFYRSRRLVVGNAVSVISSAHWWRKHFLKSARHPEIPQNIRRAQLPFFAIADGAVVSDCLRFLTSALDKATGL